MQEGEIGGIVRAVLSAIGGIAVAKGYADQETVVAVAGALTTLVVAVWSVLNKRAKPNV